MASANQSNKPACQILVLDAGPLLSLAPLRGLAEIFYTVPQVLEELKDKRAREHFRQLGLSAGVRVEVKTPDPASLAHVINFAKKTGDYSVLSHADLCILALTYALSKQQNEEASSSAEASDAVTNSELNKGDIPTDVPHVDEYSSEISTNVIEDDLAEEPPLSEGSSGADEDVAEEIEGLDEQNELVGDHSAEGQLETEENDEKEREILDVELQCMQNKGLADPTPTPESPSTSSKQDDDLVYDDPSDEDGGDGEWITPGNVLLHKSRALHLLPGEDAKARKGPAKQIGVGCMTADFAMQNVLLQMRLSLVGVEGKRIEKVKTWVLRCHACFKICKDNARKFCPSCGNPTLLRASVTLSSPTATSSTPTLQVHLKKNFQYKTRGTVYSIPAPKSGSAKTGPGEGLVLREDQTAWMRAQKRVDGKREREEKRMLNGALHGKADTAGVVLSWMDPDWVPEILSTGTGGKGRNMKARGMDGDMPIIGYGKKNPNERKRRK